MTISTTDLKIYRSQRNRDTADGGGAMSPNEVVDGELNNVFDDISSQDRVTGRVSIRKVFPGAYSANVDRYFGAGLVIVAPAEDPAVDVLMTSTGSFTDERADVVERIESYLIPGATISWRLFNDHLTGTGALTLYGVPDSVTPDLGDTLFLEETGGNTTEAVKVQQIVSRSTQTFIDDNGAFQRDVLILQLTRPLQNNWSGTEVLRRTTGTPPTRLRSFTVSAGARYSGVKPAENVTANDTTIKVDSPFSRIVPSTTAETPITDENASLGAVSYAKVGSDGAITVSTGSESFTAGETKSFFLGGTVFPGSISITGTADATDNGTGVLTFTGSQTTGVVDYQTGEVAITRISSGWASFTITATPGAAVSENALTVQVPVTVQTRALNYIRTLRPLPAPGTISVDYRALDNWFRLTDNGNGVLAGAQPGEGGGTVNYATGTVSASLSALPDIGTTIIFRWGTGVAISDVSANTNIASQPPVEFTLSQWAAPGSIAIQYTSSSSTVNVEDSNGDLVLQGTATVVGRVNYSRRRITLTGSYPDAGTSITVTYNQRTTEPAENFAPTPAGATDSVTFSLATPPEAGTVRITWPVQYSANGVTLTGEIEAVDDGAGTLTLSGDIATNAGGTINYTSGAITLPLAAELSWSRPAWIDGTVTNINDVDINSPQVGAIETITATGRYVGGTVRAHYQPDGAASTSASQTIAAPPIAVELAPTSLDPIVAGSVRFSLNGRTYVDRNGDLVHSPSVANNAGTVAGTIDYNTGRAEITDWAGGSFTLSVVGLGAQRGRVPISNAFFRTPAAPIAQASLTVSARRLDNNAVIQATADLNGDITSANITGFVDADNGIVEVFFGETVTAAGNEAEWWYNASAVDGSGNIFRPLLVDPSSVTFSCVAFISIPLDPQILGLDPIRLPSDGRVPVYRPGDTLVISQRNTVTDAAPAAGATVDLGITNVRWVRVKDSLGVEVLSEHYTINGPAGDLVWSNPLDLAAYSAPYTIEAMSYFMRLCTDVQINGTIGLGAPAPFAMSNTDAPVFLSTKLIFTPDGGNQDLQGLVTNFFTQESWTSVWSNEPIGPGTTGQYDDATYPIVMRNDGSITERWRLEFTGSGSVNVIGERLGQIVTGASIAATIAPVNPATGQPYFSINPAGWSGGWVVGNQVRFNTLGANFPVWLIRSTQPGDPGEQLQDRFIAHLMGDVAQ